MYGTCARFSEYLHLLFLPSLSALAVLTTSTVSSLVLVTGVKIAKINTSFLASRNIGWHNVTFIDSCST